MEKQNPGDVKISSFLTALGVNAVPAFGWFGENWSPGTTLAVYWFENLAFAVFLALQIIIHRRLNPVRGHFAYTEPSNDRTGAKTFLGAYFPRILVFIGAHALFLGLLLGVFFPQKFGASAGVDIPAAIQGAGFVLLFLAINFLVTLPSLGKRPFRYLETAGQQSQGRIVLVQLTIIGGMFLAFLTDSPKGLFGIFIVLKTLTDLGSYLPQYQPKTPPRWMARIMDRIPPAKGVARPNETFTEYWQREDKDELARQARNEEPLKR